MKSVLDNLTNEAYDQFMEERYLYAIASYQRIIDAFPEDSLNYWNLGLCHLLSKDCQSALVVWSNAINNNTGKHDQPLDSLVETLTQAAQKQQELERHENAVAIYRAVFNLKPRDLNCITSIAQCLTKLEGSKLSDIQELRISELIDSEDFIRFEPQNLYLFLDHLLSWDKCEDSAFSLIEKIYSVHQHFKDSIINKLSNISLGLQSLGKADRAIQVAEFSHRLDSHSLNTLKNLIDFYVMKDNQKAIINAQKLYELSLEPNRRAVDRVLACEWNARALIFSCLHWHESKKFQEEYEVRLKELVDSYAEQVDIREATGYLMTTGFYTPYFVDNPRKLHKLLQSVRQLANHKISLDMADSILKYKKQLQLRKQNHREHGICRPLKIGYISACFRRHSVGYLARWMIQNHDHEHFEIYGYMGESQDEDILRNWYKQQFHKAYIENIPDVSFLAELIQKDGIDILIDLDSITGLWGTVVSSLKPTPIQATWLGWDAVGQEKIDYFIADPYVLPENAEEFYAEKIWRLPQNYIAVDGFESSTPTIRRDTLDIPTDAVIYFSAQVSMKRHPDTMRLQMRIIKAVPNAYLLFKGFGDQDALKGFFYQMADNEGVGRERLRFLPTTSTEAEHRANLIIADVVLDTYPYNGATHTLEVLWMGIPMVTRVGEQFAARNSYTMMINAGITEGIAWTDEEYVEWGIKLGTDHDLRNQVILKLRQGKQTAPLWNSRQFTKDMESAYEQMWQVWLDTEDPDIEIDPVADCELFIAEAELRNQDAIRLAQKGKLDSAIACWQAAISLYPEYIDAHYNMGIAQVEAGNLEDAIASFQTTIELDSSHANALYNLGLTLSKQNKLDEAIAAYDQAFELSPEDIDIPLALGSAFFRQGEWEWAINAYQSALEINPESVIALGGLGATLIEYGEVEEAINCLQSALEISSNDSMIYANLGHAFARSKQTEDAAFCYQKALRLDPSLGHAYWNFNNDILADIDNPANRNFKLRRELADQFLESCYKGDKIRSLINYITNYANSGLGDLVKENLLEVENLIYENCGIFTEIEIQVLYNHLLFILPNLRDHRQNINVYRLIGEIYRQRIIEPKIILETSSHLRDSKEKLKIGFISSHFARHPVGWCSLDVIQELSNITPHIYLYATGEIKIDERTREFAQVAEKSYWYDGDEFEGKVNSFDSRLNQVIEDITQDQLDIIIDLDSVTIPINTHILCRNLAPVCLSWLGFDAPFVSSENYWLGDRFTHPEGVDEYYLEKILRLPDAHIAVSGFESVEIDRDIEREKLGIASDQVAYLYAAPARKFNRDSARACISILQRVPNSVLLHKGNGDREVIRNIYQDICEEIGVDEERVIFLPSYKTEEEHRGIYAIADVFLDSYPYNGGSHNLEVLWFNLPVVTLVGEQSFARMGYSFLQALGIDAGIAHSWEEYIVWAVRYGLETEFRNSIKQKLIDSKNPTNLAPLWNPQKLAQDMYNLLQEIFEGV